MNSYQETVMKFQRFMKINGFDATQERERYAFGGMDNEKYPPISIILPFFKYDEIDETGFFENQKNYDISICKTTTGDDKKCVMVTILLKDLYSSKVCEESEFINILKKIKAVKSRFLLN